MNVANLGLLCAVSPAIVIVLSVVMLAVGVGSGIGLYMVVMNKKTKYASKNADKILVITKDGIAESGSHEDLVAQNGLYSTMYKMYRV